MNISTIIGFDFGMKRIGTAIGQTVSNNASPLRVLPANDGVPNWQQLQEIIDEWQPQALVVGIPIMIDGSNQHTTFAAKKFAKKLRARTLLTVYEVDERLTTVEARALLFEVGGYKHIHKSQIDCMAAALIVEQWLNGI